MTNGVPRSAAKAYALYPTIAEMSTTNVRMITMMRR